LCIGELVKVFGPEFNHRDRPISAIMRQYKPGSRMARVFFSEWSR
jgi:hypothetical protein